MAIRMLSDNKNGSASNKKQSQNLNQRYQNLNLNQNRASSVTVSPSLSSNNHSNGFGKTKMPKNNENDFDVSQNVSWKNPPKETSRDNFEWKLMHSELNEKNKKAAEKRQNEKDLNSNAINNSTLSLHILAYENGDKRICNNNKTVCANPAEPERDPFNPRKINLKRKSFGGDNDNNDGFNQPETVPFNRKVLNPNEMITDNFDGNDVSKQL
uniref:Uncharacterized protein n=1 Tax=Panagrolaimus superbus TaxID=310955 RepID=A0A914YTU2_9BILA